MPYKITEQQMERVWNMPPCSHYPDRTQKFNFANSHVIKFLEKELDVNIVDACKAFERLRRNGDILYDPTDKMWRGRRLMQPAGGAQ